jgi:hypothetical protein
MSIDLRIAFEHDAFATAAPAFAAAMGQRNTLAKSRIQHPFTFLDFQLDADRLQAHGMSHLFRHDFFLHYENRFPGGNGDTGKAVEVRGI